MDPFSSHLRDMALAHSGSEAMAPDFRTPTQPPLRTPQQPPHRKRRTQLPSTPAVAPYATKTVSLSWQKTLHKPPTSSSDPLLASYNRSFFGVDDPATRPSVCEYFAKTPALVSDFLCLSDLVGPCSSSAPAWKASLPSPSALQRTPFGRSSSKRSFTQQACFETVVFNVFQPIAGQTSGKLPAPRRTSRTSRCLNRPK